MKKYLDRLSPELRRFIALAQETSQERACRAYLVGGFVRDALLGVKNFDVDIAVEQDGIAFAQAYSRRIGGCHLVIHPRFGTATITTPSQVKIDISTTRKESYPAPASLPVVQHGGLDDDLFRRDFTINALAISLSADAFGELVDPFGGRQDIADKKIRVMHAASFIDDPTRILRAVRFEQRYGFRIEARTRRYLGEAVRARMLEKVQPQRTRDELVLLLKEPSPSKCFRRLHRLGGLAFVSARLRWAPATASLLERLRQRSEWFVREHSHRRGLDLWLLFLMGILDECSLAEVRQVCRKFVFHKGQEKRLVSCKKVSARFIDRLEDPRIKPSVLFRMLEPLSYEVILFLMARYPRRSLLRNIEGFLLNHNGTKAHLTGHDLLSLGIAPGPCYQEIFRRLIDARLDGLVTTRAQELEYVKNELLPRCRARVDRRMACGTKTKQVKQTHKGSEESNAT